MQAVLFSGVQATGKSSFYRERFFRTHVRVSLDLVRTRAREARLLELCLDTGQPFVVDNTNVSREERRRYIVAARAAAFEVSGFYFASALQPALARNRGRDPADQVPDKALLGTYARLELPSRDEGYDALSYVRLTDLGFRVEPFSKSPAGEVRGAL